MKNFPCAAGGAACGESRSAAVFLSGNTVTEAPEKWNGGKMYNTTR